jgi:hypothetical protein
MTRLPPALAAVAFLLCAASPRRPLRRPNRQRQPRHLRVWRLQRL